MEKFEDIPKLTADLAWEAAFSLNEAYDQLQKEEKIAQVIIPDSETTLQAARDHFETLANVVGAFSVQADSPYTWKKGGPEQATPNSPIQQDTAPVLDVDADPSAAEKKSSKKSEKPLNKNLNFGFRAEKESFYRSFQTRRYTTFSDDIRLLLAVGQVQAPAYSCFDTDEKRAKFVKTMVNKGRSEKDLFEDDDISTLLDKAVSDGLIQVNGKGPEITDQGILAIKADAKVKKSKSQPVN